jgi:hypothetical protein
MYAAIQVKRARKAKGHSLMKPVTESVSKAEQHSCSPTKHAGPVWKRHDVRDTE